MNFAEKLKTLMKDLDLSQAKLSALTGIGKSSISQYLSGKNEPTRDRKKEIALALGVQEDYFEAFDTAAIKHDGVLNLPDQIVIPIHSEAPKKYKKFMRDEIITIGEKEFIGDTILSKIMYARMICGYLNENRITAFRDLVQSTEDRLIVFYNFNDELNIIQNIIFELERPFSIVNGSTKDLTAYEEADNSVTLIQYQAGAMGLNLQKANKIVYFSLTNRSELFEQSKKRIHRIGQKSTCFYYVMLCPCTVKEDILHTLELRKDYTDELFKEHEKGFNR